MRGTGRVAVARERAGRGRERETVEPLEPLPPTSGPIPVKAKAGGGFGAAMKAGATSMWASCCGLLNEVMGTGAVRSQQPGFGSGANPFRFAPSTDFTVYSSAAAAGANGALCKSCGLSFSVFRKKHTCCECKKDFCSVCSVLQDNLRRCCTCQLLQEAAFQRPQLMRLKVKDLRQYLLLRNIPTDTCREKEDLVDLILRHHGLASEEETDTSSLYSARSQASSLSTQHVSLSGSVSPSQGDLANRQENAANETQLQGPSERLSADLGAEEDHAAQETPGQSRKRARASLSDISSLDDVEGLTVRQLKEILACNFVNYSGCCEKWELVEKVSRLYRENQTNHRLREKPPLTDEDDNLCRICMDAVIDCVLLECGHMVACTKCGKRMSECPICRQFVVRAVHVFKS
ncbi:E3 ubiquitin-protein ligase RNF34 isoform X2 [Thamnophis elegans]|uniref:E3 ubiquitin-protein ligase RNF34 isoform X2 n=1 Tax=Thamnophis elegans TaxID=35005 RepID=UPI001378FDA5|nr:E3 ubiquitin-protein ligase RNF34 isoform X2 [Thamnophis elegans]